MKSRRGRIIAIVAAVLVIAMILHIGRVYGCYPKMTSWEKEKILNVLNEYSFDYYNLFWYEDNGFANEPGATRYIGTYGDCYAFLILGSGYMFPGFPYEGPVKIYGLSRDVYFPIHAYVVLYQTDPSFPRRRVWLLGDQTEEVRRLYISDWQLERLTRDVEKLAEQYS